MIIFPKTLYCIIHIYILVMGGAILVKIHMYNRKLGGIEIEKHFYRFRPGDIKIIFNRFNGD